MERDAFLNLPAEKIVDLVKQKGRPYVGIFVPDGNRRLLLAATDLQENTEEFFSELIYQHTSAYLKILEIFFRYGLSSLFIPLFSRSVLSRKSSYGQKVVLETIRFIFTNDQCLNFYKSLNIRIKIYGNISVLSEYLSSQVIPWAEELQEYTRNHTSRALFIGIGGEPVVGYDTAIAAIQFYQTYQRSPTRIELIEYIYGQSVPEADFFIMSSKFAGLGALPGLVCGKDTKAYYLPTPGLIGFNRQTYLMILYDLLYMNPDKSPYKLSADERKQLYLWYNNHATEVWGLGKVIGTVSVPCYYSNSLLGQSDLQ